MQRVLVLIVAFMILISAVCPSVYATEVTEPTEATESPTEDTTDREHGGGGSSMDEETTKKWYDYLADIIVNGFQNILHAVTAPFEVLIGPIITFFENQDTFMALLANFSEVYDQWSDGFEEEWKQITDFFDNLNVKSINFVKSIWEFPIVKELTVGLVALIIISAIFGLLKSGL
jgi:hypothetical protein